MNAPIRLRFCTVPSVEVVVARPSPPWQRGRRVGRGVAAETVRSVSPVRGGMRADACVPGISALRRVRHGGDCLGEVRASRRGDVTHLNGALGRSQFNVEPKGSPRMPTPGVMRGRSCGSVVHLTRHALAARWIPVMEEARRSTDAGRAERHGIMDRRARPICRPGRAPGAIGKQSPRNATGIAGESETPLCDSACAVVEADARY